MGIREITSKKQIIKIHARKCESFFNNVVANGKEIGLSVNEDKTKILCMRTSKYSDINCFIRLPGGTEVIGQKELKQVGF